MSTDAVTFVEIVGPDGGEQLARLAARLPEPAATELLRHADEAHRWLLVVRGEVTGPDVPGGARTWRFVRVAAP